MFEELSSLKKWSLTKKLFAIFLSLLIFSLIVGLKLGFQTEFPFPSFFTPKFSSLVQVSLFLSFCLGFSLAENELRTWKYKNKRLLLIFFLTLLLLSTYETLLSFNAWFSVYSRRGESIDKLTLVTGKDHMNASGVFKISELEEELNISIPKKILFPVAAKKGSTYNSLTKINTSLNFISLFGILMTYKMLDRK